MVINKLGSSKDIKIKHLILDVLKPHHPDIIELSKALAEVRGVDRVTIDTLEIDQETESVKIEIEGSNIDFEMLLNKIREMGASLHSIDSVTTEYSKGSK